MKIPFTQLFKQGSARQQSEAQTELDDMRAQHQMLLTPPPRWSRILIWTLSIGSLSLLGWSIVNKLEETASLPGQLETLRSEVSIKSPDTAILEAVHAVPFQLVKQNQILFELSRKDLQPRILSLKGKLLMLEKRNQHEQESIHTRLIQAKAQIDLNRNIAQRLETLFSQGSVQEVQLLEKRNELFQNETTYQTLLEDRAKAELNYKIEANDVSNQLKELEERAQQFVVRSPISGRLQRLAVQAKGERVQVGDVLATVIPGESLIAALQVTSKLAAPIREGKAVEITVDAFPANDYGTLKGVVSSLSPTTSTDPKGQSPAYVARVRIKSSGIPAGYPSASLRSGMGLTGRVVLHEKPMISLVFDFVEDLFKPLSDRR